MIHVIPAVETIEEALTTLPTEQAWAVADELKEFRGLGSGRLSKAVFPAGCSDIEKGYLLGLETARLFIAGMPVAVQAGVKF